jgi:proteasome lid subunit RPN8/RPN11
MPKKKRKKIEKILVHAEPFFTMILSALEVYKRETFGLLFSYTNRNIIDLAYPCQTTERGFARTRMRLNIQNKLEKEASDFGLRCVGTYHSHADYAGQKVSCNLSDGDKKAIRESSFLLQIIISVNEQKGIRNIKLAAHYYDSLENKIKNPIIIFSKKIEYNAQRYKLIK